MVEGGGIEKQSLTREQIFAAMDRQFEKFVGWHIDGIRQRKDELVGVFVDDEAGFEAYIQEEQGKLTSLKREERMRTMMNNFFLRLPGSWYRQMIAQLAADPADSTRTRTTQLCNDLDTYIHDAGLETEAALIANKEWIEPQRQLEVLSRAYLHMLEKGYSMQELMS